MMINNEDRADLAEHALDAFYSQSYTIDGETKRTAFGDLMIDMRHLADRLGLDWDTLMGGCASAYQQEVCEFPPAERQRIHDSDEHYAAYK